MTTSPTQQKGAPSEVLREVPMLLRTQWKQHVASRATLLRWLVADDEWDWVEEFLKGPLDGRSKLFAIEQPADAMDGYGFAAGSPLLQKLAKTKLGNRPAWATPPIARGMRDTDALATLLGSFAQYARGSSLETIGVLLAPERIRDERAWLAWVESFAGAFVRIAPGVRIVVLDDAKRPLHESLARTYGAAVSSLRCDLGIGPRISAMVEAAADPTTLEGQLRVLGVRALESVGAGRLDDAARFADAIEAIASRANQHGAVVPVRFAVASALTGAQRHVDAVRTYRAAEAAAERAEASGDANGLWLRIMARFGVAAGLLAAPNAAAQAARYYEETAPLCERLGDPKLELEAHRCAAVAHELARAYSSAWNAAVRALGLVDRLTPAAREDAMLVPLADAMLRLTETRELGSYRSGLERELRKRQMRGTRWA